MGSAGGKLGNEIMERCYRLGAEIAKVGCIVLTGGCPGLPQEVTRGAKDAGGITVGISPGLNLAEHVERYKSPTEYLDLLIFTGSGLMGREVIGARSCDAIIITGGRSGTLGEFAIAYDEGKPSGALLGTGGITTEIPDIIEKIRKSAGSKVVYDRAPAKLVKKLLEALEASSPKMPRYEAGEG